MISNKDLRQHPLDLLVRRTEANERRTSTRLLSSAGTGAATPPPGSRGRIDKWNLFIKLPQEKEELIQLFTSGLRSWRIRRRKKEKKGGWDEPASGHKNEGPKDGWGCSES